MFDNPSGPSGRLPLHWGGITGFLILFYIFPVVKMHFFC